MGIYVIIEILIFGMFIYFSRDFISSKSNILSFAAVIASSVLFEIANERVFSSQGTFYPSSLFYVPYFKFPVAIVCLSAVYAFTIFLAARKMSGYFKGGFTKAMVFLVSVSILNFLSIFIEKVGMLTGYWVHHRAPGVLDIWHWVYGFYFLVILAGSLIIACEIVISGATTQSDRETHID